MMDEAKALGLAFEGDIFDTYRALAAPTGRMYDSRGGSGALWRYQPRNVEVLMNKKIRPLVHHCVITRMMSGNDGYAPFSLPLGVSILLPDRTRVSFDMQGVANARAATKRKTAGAKPEELPALKDTENVLADLGAVVQASAKLPRDDYFALVLDTVWIRRIVYFVTLILALTALAYPVLYEILDFGDNTEKLDDITSGFLVYVIALVKGFVPSFATPWLDAISANGLGAVIIGVLFVLSLALSTFLQRRIHDRARAAWNVQRTGPKADRLKPTGQRHALLTLTMIGAVLTGFTIPVANDNKYLLATIAIFTVVFFALYLYRRIRPSGAVDPSHPRFPLSLARSLRTSPRWVSRYRWVAQTLAPILFIAAVGYLALCVVNLTAFNVASTVGGLCPDIPDAQQPAGTRPDPKIAPRTPQQLADAAQEEILTGVKTIDVRSLCHPTGLKLVAGRQYRIRLETQKEWFDKSIPVDVAGFSTDGIRHALASPLKRWWREKWFQPIARVGLYGNYEYPLKPAAPLAEANFSQCPKPPESKAFPVALAEGIAGFVKALLNPGKIIDDVRDIPKQASSETIAAQLACERDPVNDIRRAKVLIADITPGHSGELFIYVNDAVIAWPGLTRLFYNNNTGTADVSVTRTVAPATVDFTADRPAKWEPTQSKK